MLASETNETTYHVRYQSYVISLLLVLVPPAMLYQLGPSLLDGSIKTGELAGLGIGIILPLVGAYYMLEFASFTFSTDEDVFRWHWNNLLRRKSGAVPLGRVARVRREALETSVSSGSQYSYRLVVILDDRYPRRRYRHSADARLFRHPRSAARQDCRSDSWAPRPLRGNTLNTQRRRRVMAYYVFKVAISALLIVAIAEISKRSSFIGALLASVPLVSVLAMVWLYVDTRDSDKVAALASGVFWLVLPSLALFIALPLMLKQGYNFYLSMGLSILITIGCYWLMVTLLNQAGIEL
jgi:uncharacterized membrane protein (GlpM family)